MYVNHKQCSQINILPQNIHTQIKNSNRKIRIYNHLNPQGFFSVLPKKQNNFLNIT